MIEQLPQNERNELSLIVRELAKILPIDEIILFGSYAYGTPHEYSDYDLCIVTEVKLDNEDFVNPIWEQINRIQYKVKGLEYVKPLRPTQEELEYVYELGANADMFEVIGRINEITPKHPRPQSPLMNCYYISRELLTNRSMVKGSMESEIVNKGIKLYPITE